MKGFTKGLVQHRILIIILCIALVVPSVLGMVRTKTKYDLLYYLPQDLETVQGQEILLKDFGKGAFSLLVTEGMNLKDQADMENALKEIPHVDSVIGYASLTKGTLPVEIIPDDIREKFQRGDCMLSAVFFDEGSSSEETMEAISQVRKVAGEKTFVSGLSAVVTDTRQLVEDQEAIYVAIAVALCAVVLMLTMAVEHGQQLFPGRDQLYHQGGGCRAAAGCDAGLFHFPVAQLQGAESPDGRQG